MLSEISLLKIFNILFLDEEHNVLLKAQSTVFIHDTLSANSKFFLALSTNLCITFYVPTEHNNIVIFRHYVWRSVLLDRENDQQLSGNNLSKDSSVKNCQDSPSPNSSLFSWLG